MEHLPGFSYTINFGADCFKYNMYLQSLKSILFKISKLLYPAILVPFYFRDIPKIMGTI